MIASKPKFLLPTGTKSLLFGVHQVFWHPITLCRAWRALYDRRPAWRELICIIIHDWGYWGKPSMDGPEGETHPEWAAKVAGWLFDRPHSFLHDPAGHPTASTYANLCLLHSTHYARTVGAPPSDLCWADKQALLYDPWWLYLPRAWLSGELAEYRKLNAEMGLFPAEKSHREWYTWITGRLAQSAQERQAAYSRPVKKTFAAGQKNC